MRFRALFSLFFAVSCLQVSAQLRVATWNISSYSGGRVSDIQTAVFDSFQARAMNPDIILTQEIMSVGAMNAFLGALNTALGTSGTWQAGPFINGNDTDGAIFYRFDRIILEATTVISTGGGAPLPPRDTVRYDVRLRGYIGNGPKVALYNSHMKSGATSLDESRRLAEAFAIRTNAQNLGSSFSGFAVAGDFNTPTSTDDGYDKLVGNETNNAGRFFDPISTPGSWNNNSFFRFVHTQDPSGAAGMDSRFDFILLSDTLVNNQGFDYIGSFGVPYSTTNWNDPNHSYRAWGNDGTSYGVPLTTTGNAMVGSAIAQAIKNAATTAGGHIPVFLDLRAPAELGVSNLSLDFGNVVQGTPATLPLTVSNSVDTLIWRTGIANLLYSFGVSAGFGAPGGSFSDSPGGSGNTHQISVETTTLGPKSGTLTVVAEDNQAIPLSANVIPDAIAPSAMTVTVATHSGGLIELATSNDQRVVWQNSNWANGGRFTPVVLVELTSTSSLQTPSSLTFELEANAAGSFVQKVELFDYDLGQYVTLSSTNSTPLDSTAIAVAPNAPRYVQAGTKQMRAQISYTPFAWTMGRTLSGGIDRAVWKPR
ncbi:MAG: endonuclease/exonuclease/phosphatase family protein [Fimbriimonadaceae bacterium]